MSVDRRVVERLLGSLEETVATLRRLQSVSVAELQASPERAWAVEHGLQIAIQTMLDVGNHVLAGEGANGVEEYVDVVDGLAEKGILPRAFADSMRPMVGFRNLLVHGYARVDLARVHELLRTRLDDFEVFAGHVSRWLDSR
jgi:uncharacterized protein YutE (UPF0331/DUF86 family)